MAEISEDVEILRRAGSFGSRDEFLREALKALLEKRPELRVELGVAKYREGEATLNRAAEISGLSSEEFKEVLKSRGVRRDVDIVSEESREEILKDL